MVPDERRRRPRIPLFEPALLRRRGAFHPAQLTDLSAFGTHFETDADLRIGEIIRLELSFPWTNATLLLDASVVRVQREAGEAFSAAVQFCRIHPDAIRLIEIGVRQTLAIQRAPTVPRGLSA